MATPHVAGAAALIMSEQGLDAQQTRSKLKSSAVAGLSTGGRKECASYPALNLAAALGGGGGSTPPPTGTGAIGGRVSDAASGAGLSGATVNCGTGGTATTGSTGTYSLTNVPSGSYSCTASATGYRSKTQTVTVTTGATTTSDFGLRAR